MVKGQSSSAYLAGPGRKSITATFRQMLDNDISAMNYQHAAELVQTLVQQMGPSLDLSRLLRWEVAEDIFDLTDRLSAKLGEKITLPDHMLI